jgi:lipid II:glycine glycyltransferase (peptidoglycan interpeptide bridge formation enzyme)
VADLARRGGLRTSLKPGPLAAATWSSAMPGAIASVPHTVHTLDLAGGFEAVWGTRFSTKTRTKIRKAERAGLEVRCGSAGRSVDAFYALYLASVERWLRRGGEPDVIARWRWKRDGHEARRKFELVAQRLGDACRIWVASSGGVPAAAIIVLTYGAHAVYWRAAMDSELAGPTRANYLLQRRAIEAACAAGCRAYHMGESSPSIAEFKRAFGAVPMGYAEYRVERLPLTAMQDRARAAAGRLQAHARGHLRSPAIGAPPAISRPRQG